MNTGEVMSFLITFLQILGLIVLALIAFGFAARKTVRARGSEQAEARIGAEAPSKSTDTRD